MLDQYTKQKIVLFITKYLSYLINIVIGLAVAGGIYLWVTTLIKSAQ